MDPTACLRDLDAALAAGDREDVCHHADALRSWIQGGGFLPRFEGNQGMGLLTRNQWLYYLKNIHRAASAQKGE